MTNLIMTKCLNNETYQNYIIVITTIDYCKYSYKGDYKKTITEITTKERLPCSGFGYTEDFMINIICSMLIHELPCVATRT